MSYTFQLHAMTELAILGIPGIERKLEFHPDPQNEEMKDLIEKLKGPLNLKVTGDKNMMDLHSLKAASEFVQNFSYLAKFQIISASHCLVMGHEVTKDKAYRNKDPLWEFLRHCRNAVAHNGVFRFSNNEPKYNAEWRGIKIEKSMEGRSLMKDQNGNGYLNLGDPIALLWDIEEGYPEITI